MLERHETFLGEQMRRHEERRYAETHRLAKQAGLPVSIYRKMLSDASIRLGTRLVSLGRKMQGPFEGGATPLMDCAE